MNPDADTPRELALFPLSDRRFLFFKRLHEQDEVLFDDLGDWPAPSRSNVIEAVKDEGLVYETSEGVFRLTRFGEKVIDGLFDRVNRCEEVVELRDFLMPALNRIPKWEENLCDPFHLKNAVLVKGDIRLTDNEAVRKYRDLIADASEIKELVDRELVTEFFIVQMEQEEDPLEDVVFMVDEEMVERARDYKPAREKWQRLEELGADHFEVPVPEIPFTLSIFDNETVGIYTKPADDEEVFLFSDNNDVLDWANRTYDDYWEKREPAEL